MMFAGNFEPRGWAFCNGQLLPIAQNSALFSILGTTYGGDGQTTFALPDLRGRAPVHFGHGPGLTPRTLGEKTGSENVTLTVNNIPPHTHSLGAFDRDAKATTPQGNVLGRTQSPIYSSESPSQTLSPASIGTTGEGQPASVMQPVGVINFIIALQGIFPSRG
ncbi:MAG: tail fiber protein [Enhygromyxa sp.]